MQIANIEIYKLPIAIEPFAIATGTMTTAQNLFIRINTDAGISGVGECSAFPMITGETMNTCYEMAKDFALIWKNKDPLNILNRMNELHQYAFGNYTVKSAFDMALYDISAKYHEVPLYQFLGGVQREIRTDMTVGIDKPEIMAQKAGQYVKSGFKTIKVKVGKQIDKDIERIRLIRKTVGPDIKLRIDANQGWLYNDAVLALNGLEQYDIEFCEQPMPKWEDNLLPELIKNTTIPIMADESVFTYYDAKRIIKNKATNYINIKFAKCGGILEAVKIAAICAENNIKCMIGGMLESRLAMTAFAHFAIATQAVCFIDMDTALLGHLVDPIIGGAIYELDKIIVSQNQGLDVDVDPEYLNLQESVII